MSRANNNRFNTIFISIGYAEGFCCAFSNRVGISAIQQVNITIFVYMIGLIVRFLSIDL